MATHSSILACRFPGTEETGGLSSMGSQRADVIEVTEHTQSMHVCVCVCVILILIIKAQIIIQVLISSSVKINNMADSYGFT